MSDDALHESGTGICPKHGRWYGICHSCHKDAEKKADHDRLMHLYAERDALRAEVERYKAVVDAARNESYARQLAREAGPPFTNVIDFEAMEKATAAALDALSQEPKP